MELRRVVIGTDFSDRSLHAARWAAHHFASDLDIVLVHAVVLPELPRFMRGRFPQLTSIAESAAAGAMTRLREVARSMSARNVRPEVRIGDAAQQIAAVAREVGADVIVVGKHGDRPGLLHRLGTTADRLVKIAPAPVLLATGLRDVTPRRILVALDDADITRTVVEWTRLLATRFDADVIALHVVTSALLTHVTSDARVAGEATPMTPSAIRTDAFDQGVHWIRGLFDGDASPHWLTADVAFGMVGHEIVAAAERHNSELIVLGRSGAGLARRALLGNVARHVLHSARCPVLVVVEPEDAIVEDEDAA